VKKVFYTYIFNSDGGGSPLLHAQDGDISDLVLKKMGIAQHCARVRSGSGFPAAAVSVKQDQNQNQEINGIL
jgi:hypothetical protein